MGVTNSVFTSASSLLGSLGDADESSSSLYAAYRQAENFEAEAARKDIEAAQARQLGLLEQAEQTRKGRKAVAEKKVAYAAGGVKVNEGSAVEVAADIAAWSEYERQNIEAGAAMESWGLKYDAALLRRKASAVRAAGVAESGASSASTADIVGKHAMNALTKKKE